MIEMEINGTRRGMGFNTADINDISDQTNALNATLEQDLDDVLNDREIRPGKKEPAKIPDGHDGYVLGELVEGPYVRETIRIPVSAAKACIELQPEKYVYMRKEDK